MSRLVTCVPYRENLLTVEDVYLGMQLAVIPTALTELAPAQLRGGMCALYWLSIKVGGLVVTSIARGTSTIKTDAAFRIPYGLLLVVPSIVISLIWVTPESPRWLLLRDRHSDALQSLIRLKPKGTSSDEIEADFQIISEKIAVQLQKKRFRDLFTAQNRMRTFIPAACNFFQQVETAKKG